VEDGYLAFEENAGALTYAAKGNLGYKDKTAWAGAVSMWVSVDVDGQTADFPEPFHVGKKEGNSFMWDDAVVFIDFTKPPRALRFGCYPDKTEAISDEMVDQRVIQVSGLKWKADRWHHLVATWSNFNSGSADAEWAFFVDGTEKGRKKGLRQDVSWDLDNLVIRFNHTGYVGKVDEIAIFDKMLTPGEAKYLSKPKKPLNALLKKDR
jgi:hypothetical protein